jgi:hypothetical protein
MTGIQNKKFISRKLIVIGLHVSGLCHWKGKLNDVDTTGTGSMRVVDSRVAISYSCSASF